MSFAGTVADMVSRSKQNRGMLNSQRGNRNDLREHYQSLKNSRVSGYKDKEISAEELQKIKNDIRKSMALERRRSIIFASLLTVAVMVIIVAIILLYLNNIDSIYTSPIDRIY